MSIIRYDPFRDLRALQDEVNRLFTGNMARFDDEGIARGSWSPNVDIYENKDQIVVEAELPGMNREDFDLSVENNVITLRGERRFEKQDEPEHLLCAMLEQAEGIVRPLLGKLGANVQVVLNDCQAAIARFPKVQGGQQYFSPRLTQIFTAAQKQAEKMQDEYISTEHLLLAIADEKDGQGGKLLRQHGVSRDDLLKAIEQTRGGARITDQNAEAN